MKIAFIAVDWGTTNLRAWAVGANGALLAEAESAQGIGALSGDGFADVLRALVGDWTDGCVPILLGGMIGSRQGWHEAPYLACPARVETLAAAAFDFDTGIGRGWIVPGLSYRAETGVTDVMRGEEVQLCGLERGDGLVVLPGTHSKWVEVRDDQIVRFRTFMTGELFALLKAHSILGRLMVPGEEELEAFDVGVARAVADPALTALLFSVRAEALFDRLPPHALADYLSGLLVGAEIGANADRRDTATTIVGSGLLARRYARALERAGFSDLRIVDGTAAATRGLTRIARQIPGAFLA